METLRIQDLSAQTIANLLSADGSDLTPQQLVAIREFIHDVGGLENACAAVRMLCELEGVEV